ncbi:MAG: hypothetical protein HC859_03335 [Bacteroidia bacterium]|nr:hypothetical protein [Bacteroidia bacterium]
MNDSEVELMLKAPMLVCILIAGADGKIDRKEIKEAIATVEKQLAVKSPLTSYFREVAQDFEDKLKILIQGYPYESSQRIPLLVEELGGINEILTKLSREFAQEFYQMLKNLAEKVASSSGGLLGYKSIGAEEAKYLQLQMIRNPSIH